MCVSWVWMIMTLTSYWIVQKPKLISRDRDENKLCLYLSKLLDYFIITMLDYYVYIYIAFENASIPSCRKWYLKRLHFYKNGVVPYIWLTWQKKHHFIFLLSFLFWKIMYNYIYIYDYSISFSESKFCETHHHHHPLPPNTHTHLPSHSPLVLDLIKRSEILRRRFYFVVHMCVTCQNKKIWEEGGGESKSEWF